MSTTKPLTRGHALDIIHREGPFLPLYENAAIEARRKLSQHSEVLRGEDASVARNGHLLSSMMTLELEIDAGNLNGAVEFIGRVKDLDARSHEELRRYGVRYLTKKLLTDEHFTIENESAGVEFIGMVVQQFYPEVTRPDKIRELYVDIVKPVVLDVAESLTHQGDIPKLVRLLEISEFDTSRTEALVSSAIQNAALLGRYEDAAIGVEYMSMTAEQLLDVLQRLLRSENA